MAVAVIQARMGSSRLPGKVLRQLADRSVLGWVVRAAAAAETVNRVVVATTTSAADSPIQAEARAYGVEVVRGPELDVLARFLLALDDVPAGTPFVRLTADCPLIDPCLIDACVLAFGALDVDYLSTISPRSLPRGLDIEVASVEALRRADREATGVDRVHVTSYLYRESGRFRVAGLSFDPPADDLRVTLDTEEDAEALDAIVAELGDHAPTHAEVVELLRRRPDIVAINADTVQKALEDG